MAAGLAPFDLAAVGFDLVAAVALPFKDLPAGLVAVAFVLAGFADALDLAAPVDLPDLAGAFLTAVPPDFLPLPPKAKSHPEA